MTINIFPPEDWVYTGGERVPSVSTRGRQRWEWFLTLHVLWPSWSLLTYSSLFSYHSGLVYRVPGGSVTFCFWGEGEWLDTSCHAVTQRISSAPWSPFTYWVVLRNCGNCCVSLVPCWNEEECCRTVLGLSFQTTPTAIPLDTCCLPRVPPKALGSHTLHSLLPRTFLFILSLSQSFLLAPPGLHACRWPLILVLPSDQRTTEWAGGGMVRKICNIL